MTARTTYTTLRLEAFARRHGLDWGIAYDPDGRTPYYVVWADGEPLVHTIGLGSTRDEAEQRIAHAEIERLRNE